jgi:hypothetical protein
MQSIMQYIDGVPAGAPPKDAMAVPRPPIERFLRGGALVVLAAATVFALFVATANAQVGRVPDGWHAVGSGAGDYAVGADLSRRVGGQGLGGGTIRSLVAEPSGLATMQQSIRADFYRGQRVRLSGFVKTGAVMNGTAALWMRVDGPAGSESSDYMRHRPVVRATDWARYDVVLDVPHDAVGISFGVLLDGPGQVWLDDVALEPIGRDTPLTGRRDQSVAGGATPSAVRVDALRRHTQATAYRAARLRPVNLRFVEGRQKP